MQFLVIGKDGTDEKATDRRLAARKAHLALGDKMEASGNRWYGCVILDDNGQMIGSMAVMDFPSESEFQTWLKNEPYVKGKVWKTIEVYKCNVKKPWKFNRPQSFYEGGDKHV
ncbi:hypothetical protein A2334_01920 [Candidatus Roizmanbacteria bacterium RIFOXYB2_FULL_38_10]|uniref:YCII-related domain-containing protein n=1 Tax=Candidatus Roizmanbacteria bacterium RIFOXYD1_FULL_38_12 TaxID=1802093 RepID=A0A1F7L212_9BACT|nr:MAG: hypothetical protein A3K47_05340 [Candidatus Roizmanbacteria bacterium RIFOXYA2_FULL_38_14]OGK64170.1 MAG: hypothetical protein A3K27_05340 [Candidatus Roizmanbacteria bacterium RIFOXYA1_FULL_37_12]OGK66016.1 MAG: hypothetical protein A3K38_05340 [Candidatus Roizmanbacteria bacterium RIFOXYB1_FULL_40_23]OGK67772.1 MAG: hypothetical protein A2334_01920 [Candidatus Roizmanbacteria bacterium RIFOXYB2_FULL_38_10]OGK70421.1 MAG: hypothetical protein A3K21_05345 [Candidatus Roizmanbacteria ba